MADDGDETELVVDTHIDLPGRDRFVRVVVRLVPVTDAYPEGVKYSMHYGTYDGATILRYDNAHADTKGHERHTAAGTEVIEFNGWRSLLARFRREVERYERTAEE